MGWKPVSLKVVLSTREAGKDQRTGLLASWPKPHRFLYLPAQGLPVCVFIMIIITIQPCLPLFILIYAILES
jgi:hypothetical protein